MYRILRIVLWPIAVLPMRVLYVLSDLLLFPIIYHIVRYRRKVVGDNLLQAFPECTDTWRKQTERDFYRFFADLLVEIPHFMHMSAAEGFRRIRLVNWEEVDRLTQQYGGCLLMTSHYGNWEWLAFVHRYINLPDGQFYNIYRKLDNVAFDRFMYNLRITHGAQNIEKNSLLRHMIQDRQQGIKGYYGMIADQSPSQHNIHYWSTLLGRPTAMLTGTETLARKLNYPVFYAGNKRIKRGYYECTLTLIAERAADLPEFAVTEQYTRLLENTIQSEPACWLWTHKRWKHSPPQDTL